MPTTVIVNNPIAFVIQLSDEPATLDLLVANMSTGVVTSAVLPTSPETPAAFLTEKLQNLLTLLPGLSIAAMKTLLKNLLTIECLEATIIATVTDVGPLFTLTLSGIPDPANIQVTIPHSIISPFTGNILSGGSGGAPAAGSIFGYASEDAGLALGNGTLAVMAYQQLQAEKPAGVVTSLVPFTFTCPVGGDGLYAVNASLYVDFSAAVGPGNSGVLQFETLKNGLIVVPADGPGVSNNFTLEDAANCNQSTVIAGVIQLAAGDTVQFRAVQANTGTVAVITSVGVAGGNQCSVVFIGPVA